MTAPVENPANDVSAARKAYYIVEITKAMEMRKAKRMEESLSPKEMGALSSSDRIVALKHGLLDNFRVIYATHPNLNVLPGVILFVSVFSDNGQGCCTYAMQRMALFFSRSERAIREALHRAVECGALGRDKPRGGRYSHWPVVFRGILDPASSPTWFVDASLPIETTHRKPPSGVAAGRTGSLLPETTGSPLPVTPEASFRYHRKPDDNVFPRVVPREFPGEGAPVGVQAKQQHRATNGQHLPRGKTDWLKELNPEAAARRSYASENVSVSISGKVTIGQAFRAELNGEGYPDAVIDQALVSASRYIEGDNPEKWMKTVRTALGWAKRDNAKADASASKQPVRTFKR